MAHRTTRLQAARRRPSRTAHANGVGCISASGCLKTVERNTLDLQRRGDLAPSEVIVRAAGDRFRPILMTTFAALFGALPLLLGEGPGSELRRPLGITVVGGLFVSQILTLYTTPAIFLVFERLSQWRTKKPSMHAQERAQNDG
jgi:Cu/Ag efflux pump CusA